MTQTLTIQFDSTSILEVQSMLEKIHAAARAGHLDFGADPYFNVSLEFASINATQDFGPLEEALDQAKRSWGVSCSYRFKPETD